jgi:Glyoxalase/Bleomycin resistance protein/Dioxygenase superfamily
MVGDYDATVGALARVAGLRVLEYGEAEEIGRRGGMTWIGDNSLEVGEPIVPGHAAARFVERFGPGMHSCAYQVEDLDATIAHLSEGGVELGVRPAPGFCFTDPRTTGGLLFEWSDFTVPEDPRTGAPEPPFIVDPLLDVRTNAFVGALLPDPVAWAETFGELFGLTEAFRHPAAEADEPVVGLAAPDCTLALFRLGHTGRARIHLLGLGVDSLESAQSSLNAGGVPILRATDKSLILDSRATGDVPLMLVEARAWGGCEAVPGGPRR